MSPKYGHMFMGIHIDSPFDFGASDTLAGLGWDVSDFDGDANPIRMISFGTDSKKKKKKHDWLVVWNIFPYIGNFIIPID